MPANRIAAIAAFLTGIASAFAGIEGSLPSAAANAVAVGVGVIGSIVTVLHFMTGAQKSEALVASKYVPAPTPVVPSKPPPTAAVVVKPLPKTASKATTPTAIVKPAPKK